MKRLPLPIARFSIVVAMLATHPCPATAQTAETGAAAGEVATEPVVIDGRVLFHLRGTTSFPATERARRARERILELARTPSFDPTTLVVDDLPLESRILAGETPVLRLVDADGDTEGVERQVLARVYVDTGQTGISRAIVAPYSVRAVPGATVSTPLSWDEVDEDLDPKAFNIQTVPRRIAERGDLLAELLDAQPDVAGAVARLAEIVPRSLRPA